jgi:1,4-alpha-glucan branching enzyme
VQFLDFVFQQLDKHGSELTSVTPGDYLAAHTRLQTQRLSPSSWGAEGYFKVWLNEGNAWMYPHQHAAEARMTALAGRFVNAADELTTRALNQAARELLLAESSDWAFQIYQGTTVAYATRRFRAHIRRFNALAEQIEHGAIDLAQLAEIEQRDNLFPELDYHLYATR